MNRLEALEYLKSKLKNKNLIKHSLAVEVCMKKLAKKLGQNTEIWGVTGLLHDLDYEDTKDDFSKHGFVTVSDNIIRPKTNNAGASLIPEPPTQIIPIF